MTFAFTPETRLAKVNKPPQTFSNTPKDISTMLEHQKKVDLKRLKEKNPVGATAIVGDALRKFPGWSVLKNEGGSVRPG